MNSSEMTSLSALPTPDVAGAVRRPPRAAVDRIGGRRLLIGIGLAAVGAGVALNWGWLTAIGVAPVLLSVAPCAAMCALGLCMPKMMGAGSSCAGGQGGQPLGQVGTDPAAALPPKTDQN